MKHSAAPGRVVASGSVAFPFSAIVGQDALKQALMIAAVDPALGGVLVFGDRGTGKSTAVRALADLLPAIEVIDGCRYNCAPGEAAGVSGCGACAAGKRQVKVSRPVPVVDLPLGATEDRLVGSIDIERALTDGVRVFEPGLLAQANRGFLYIDEVNLLEDHLVDLLLDAAASGRNTVEREGLSVRHPSRFVLVGSGNPEEGELRPQLLDRFGLAVDVTTPTDRHMRVEIVRRRDAFDRDPAAFVATHQKAEQALRKRLTKARGRLDSIEVPESSYLYATDLCLAVGTDGLRGELTLVRAARAAVALAGADVVAPTDIAAIASMALRHRLRKDPLDETASEVIIERAIADLAGASP